MTIATIPTTCSLRINRSWSAFEHPWFHHNSGRCFLSINSLNQEILAVFNEQLTSYSHLRLRNRNLRKSLLTMYALYGSMTWEPSSWSSSRQSCTNLHMNAHHNTGARFESCPRWQKLTARSFHLDLLSCSAWRFHLWGPWWEFVKSRFGRRILESQQWTRSKIEWWWVRNTVESYEINEASINTMTRMTHNN